MANKWLDEELIFPSFKAYINKLAKGLNLPPVVVIQNMIIRRLAEENAAADVYGRGESLLSEFMEKDGELITGEELYNIIYQHEKKQLELERVDQLQQLLSQYSDPVKFWQKMSDIDKDIMKRRGIIPDEILQLPEFEELRRKKKEKEEAEKEIQRMIDSGELSEPIIEWKDKKE